MNNLVSDIKMKSLVLSAPFVVCPKCGGKFYRPATAYKKLSKIELGSPEDVYYPIDVLICEKCGEISPVVFESEMMRKILPEECERVCGKVEEKEVPGEVPDLTKMFELKK